MTDGRTFDVAVVGGGPSGLTAASRAAWAGAHTILLDRMAEPGQKIVLSGGGRCNVLPMSIDPTAYVTDSSANSLRKIVRSWPLDELRAFLERDVGLRLRDEPETGKVFPASGGGRAVLDRLLALVRRAGVQLRTNCSIRALDSGAPHRLRTEDGGEIRARRVVFATGGLSYPETGSDGHGLQIARSLGHEIVEPYPALVALHCDPSPHRSLAGLSLHAALTIGVGARRVRSSGGFLFTHRGYSGPAVLNAGHVAARAHRDGQSLPITVSWSDRTPDEWLERLAPGRRTVRSVLRDVVADRLVVHLLNALGLLDAKTATLTRQDRRRLIVMLTAYPLPWETPGGFGEAEVTGGGVHLSGVDPKTLESRIVPGVHFCGEMLDAFGPIGGTNFLWAFVTGKVAGDGAARG